ncbi:MAG: ABC transporter permease, partial [Pseudomonas sp.]
MNTGTLGCLGWTLHGLLSHWRRHPLQAACLLVGLWLATALWTGVQALNSQARDSYDRAAQLFGGGQQAVLVKPGGQLIEQDGYIQLRRLGWPVSPLLQGSVSVVTPEGERRVQLMGIEPLSLPADGTLAGGAQNSEQLTAFIRSPGLAWLANDTLTDLGITADALLQLANGLQLPPLQVVANLPPGMLIVDIGRAQQLLGQTALLSELLVENQFAAGQPAIPEGLGLVWEARGEADLQRLTDSFHLNLTALGLLAFVVGLFIVHAAAGLAMEQRRGVMQTL